MKSIICFIVCVCLCTIYSYGQNTMSARFIALSSHPFANENLDLHKNTIGQKGYFSFEPGVFLAVDIGVAKRTWVGFSGSIVNSRFDRLAGNAEIFIKYRIFKYWKHFFYIGFGPTVHFSDNRDSIEDYENEERFQGDGVWKYRVSWLSGFIEYNYYLNKKTQLSFAINHLHPESFAFSVGVRFQIPAGGGKGCDCPSYR